MSRAALASKRMPQGVEYALTTLGENLRIARERRGESLRDWAARMEVSVPTLQRMERGDPTVGMGVYATAFWLCGLVEALALAADPSADRGAQEIEIARAARPEAQVKPVNPCKMNAMWVFYLERPEAPRLVGTVSLASRPTKCTFAYDPSWANDGFDLSPDLPRKGRPTVPTPLDWAAPGAIEDAMPDRWGHNTIRVLDRPARLTPLDFLYHAGDRRFGALGVSTSPERYEPYADVPLLTAASLDEANEIIQRVIAKQPLTERERMLLRSSKTMGGAHPKMLIDIEGEEWLAKFPKGDYVDVPLIEHASSVLARLVGIRTPETRAHRIPIGHVFLSKRFDRQDGRRVHALTARTMMLPEREETYAAMASVLRRLGAAADRTAAQRELFARMALNILIDNTDDHSKNHAFLRMPSGHWELAPAYDVLPQTTGLEQQAIPIALGASGSLASAVAAAAQFQMDKEEAVEAWRTVAAGVSRWKEIFDAEGVTDGDIDYVGTFIDSDYLLGMRGEDALARAWTR